MKQNTMTPWHQKAQATNTSLHILTADRRIARYGRGRVLRILTLWMFRSLVSSKGEKGWLR